MADKDIAKDARRESGLSEAIRREERKTLSPSERRLQRDDARFLAQLLKEGR